MIYDSTTENGFIVRVTREYLYHEEVILIKFEEWSRNSNKVITHLKNLKCLKTVCIVC